MAPTETMTYEDNLNSQYLSNSLSSLSQSHSTNSLIVRTYRQATQLYLTKQFREAFEILEPIITPQRLQQENGATDGNTNGDGSGVAPIAQSSGGTRKKVWVFYLSLLHAIVDLGQAEGKTSFGSTRWRQLASKVQDGTIWEEVVQHGYGGREGEVDPDVIVNLATLLLDHMQDQKLSQQRLETYLASSDSAGASGTNGHLSLSQDGVSTPMSNASSSPKQLATSLKILELYTLHVLPANSEWEYARQYIEMNDMLDDERQEAFLSALQNLREEKDGTAQRERELKEQREREMEDQLKQEEEKRSAEEARKEEEKRRAAAETEKQRTTKALNGTASTPKPKPSISSSQHNPSSSRPQNPKQQKKPPPPIPTSPPPAPFYRRASSMLSHLHQTLLRAGQGMSSISILRLLMFVLAFLLIIARRDLRWKIRRAMEGGWVKVKRTVGMGVKVSYI